MGQYAEPMVTYTQPQVQETVVCEAQDVQQAPQVTYAQPQVVETISQAPVTYAAPQVTYSQQVPSYTPPPVQQIPSYSASIQQIPSYTPPPIVQQPSYTMGQYAEPMVTYTQPQVQETVVCEAQY